MSNNFDLSLLKVGDFVTLPNLSSSYQEAHVESIGENGFIVSFGSKNMPKDFRVYGMYPPIMRMVDEVSEVWRQKRVTNQATFMYNGVPSKVTVHEYEWYLVWKKDANV